MKKRENTINRFYPYLFLVCAVGLWQIVSVSGLVPEFMLPGPFKVVKAMADDRELLVKSTLITLAESAVGMSVALALSFGIGILMDRFKIIRDIFFPVCVVSQTVPTIAIAPLLVLWLGFGAAPKIALVFITCFFPLLVGIVSGFDSADKNVLRLYRSMNAGYGRTLFDVKIPYGLESFFSGMKISASYCIVGAVIAEWLGGDGGLGVYMTRVRKGFRYDRMFGAIIIISVLSLLLMKTVEIIEKKSMPWKKYEKN